MCGNRRSHAISLDIYIRAKSRKLHTTAALCNVHFNSSVNISS